MECTFLGDFVTLDGPFLALFRKLSHKDKRSLSQVSKACRSACHRNVTCLWVHDPSVPWARFPLLKLIRCDGRQKWSTYDIPERVTALQCRGAWLGAADMHQFAALSHLRSLDLQQGSMRDVECLSTLRALQELNLNHVANVKSLQGLKQLTQLEKLHIGYSDVDRQMLHELSSALPQLLSLDVSYSRVITHTGAPDTFCYKNNSGGLTQLILDGYSDMRSLVALRLLGSFRSFSIRDCGVQTPWLVSLSHLTGLTLLDLSSNHDLTDGAMDFVALRTTLKQLAIQDLPLVTLEGLLSLAPLTRLQKLHTSLFPVTQPVESALLPVHLQRAVLDANAEVPSLFQADIIEEIF